MYLLTGYKHRFAREHIDLLIANDESEPAVDDLGDDTSIVDGGKRKRKHTSDDDHKSRGRQGRVIEARDFWGLLDVWMKGRLDDWGKDMNADEWME